jgi:small subunit ribosomal protein S17
MAEKKNKASETTSEAGTSSEARLDEDAAGDVTSASASDEAAAPDEPAASDELPASDAGPVEGAPAAEAVTPPKRKPKARKKAPAPRILTPEERQAEKIQFRRKKALVRREQRAASRVKYKASEHERQATPPREHVPGAQKMRQGVVVSDRADKTITVRIDVARRHRRYEKIVRTSRTVHAHDARNDAHIGDTVIVRECRPLSRTKRWRLVEVLARAE